MSDERRKRFRQLTMKRKRNRHFPDRFPPLTDDEQTEWSTLLDEAQAVDLPLLVLSPHP